MTGISKRAERVARQLLETDALMPDDHETLRPTGYWIDAENIEYLVQVVMDLSEEGSTK